MAKVTHFGGPGRPDAPVVIATAAVNGLAYDSHQSWAFWRADGSALFASPFRLHTGDRATMVVVRSLDPRTFGAERMSVLLQAALMHISESLSELTIGGRAAVFLCLNEHCAETTDPHFGRWQRILAGTAGSWLQHHGQSPMVHTFPNGHAGLAHALRAGALALEGGSCDLAIVGGVDSYYDPLRFDILEEQERIFDQARTDAFIPGEGAGLMVLVRDTFARQANAQPLARLETIVTAEEPAPMLSNLPCVAKGLTAAMRGVTQRLKAEGRLLEWTLDDLTNEVYRAREFVQAFPRAVAPGGLDTAGRDYGQIAADDLRQDHLPEAFGDLGAAGMPTAVAVATQAFLRGDPAARNCMVTGSSTGRDRSAILLRSMS